MIPINQQAYAIGSGTATIPAFLFRTNDPGPFDVNYPLYQVWVNTNTNAVWYFEGGIPSSGVVTAQWRSLSPVVLSTSNPTTSNNSYAIGQVWVNTVSNKFFGLTSISGTTATWIELSAGVASISQVNFQVFTGSGIYTPTTGMKYCIIEAVGGGAGGGGASISSSYSTGYAALAGGGGAGGYASGTFTAAQIGSSQTVTVGLGGYGGSGGYDGDPGNTTSVGSLISAGGGLATNTGVTITSPAIPFYLSFGGAGGPGTIGQVLATGGAGEAALGTPSATPLASNPPGIAGKGGDSYFGGGGLSVAGYDPFSTTVVSLPGNDGVLGGGGSGALVLGGDALNSGGDGGKGIVIITEFI